MGFVMPIKIGAWPHPCRRPCWKPHSHSGRDFSRTCRKSITTSMTTADDATESTSGKQETSSESWKGFAQRPAKREKTQGQIRREKAAAKYDEMKAAGMPEYSIWVRLRGEEDQTWYPVGCIAVPRSSHISEAIYANEEELLKSLYRLSPRLRKFDPKTEFQYGYQLREFPDEEIRVAEQRRSESPINLLQTWIGKLTNPLQL